MEVRFETCGCGGKIVKFGVLGQTPTHGKTAFCPKCGYAAVRDGTGMPTQRAHGFDRYGSYVGEIRPTQAGVEV